jgi:anti-sigma factor RsiW
MTCRDLAEFIMAYLDGELPPGDRAEFERHLTGCPQCVHYLNSYRSTIALSKSLAGETPENVPEDLLKAILAVRGKA